MLYVPLSMLVFPFYLLAPGFDLFFVPLLLLVFSAAGFLRVYLRAFALFPLHLAPLMFPPVVRRFRFRHGPCAGLPLRRSASLVSVL